MPEASPDLSHLRSRMEERLEELRRRSGQLEARLRERVPGEMDSADEAQGARRDREVGSADEALRDEIQRIEDALDRMDRGAYGTCEDCGEPIPPRRLEVEPHATRCVECAERAEARPDVSG